MKKVILVVDDDKANLVVVQKLLAEEYQVAAVNSGKMVFKYLEKHTPDLILLDIQMPEMDGFEVMQGIQQMENLRRIPVIFLTADRSEETEEKCFEVGAVDYIGKPFVPVIMRQRIKRTLELEDYRKNLERMVEQQLRRITQLQHDIIITMANLIESRDGTTGEHVKRTSAYVDLLVQKLIEDGQYLDVLTPQYVDYIKKAAPMHDIGKITVPDRILQKPGRLTPEEYELMQLHTTEGGRLIRENMSRIVDAQFVRVASDMASYHHEKWAGGGYPSNLQGEDIPLSARILAVADVFDALVSKRQYKEGMSLEQAFEIMGKDRGISFEPLLLDTFMQMEEELRALMAELQEGN
ncbi:MAG: response regulator [Lachnospiraceae bacterium]|nr:response regulator [Lachnospiraceae bacterium]